MPPTVRNDRVVITLFSFVLIFRVLLSTFVWTFGCGWRRCGDGAARSQGGWYVLLRTNPPAGVGDTWLNVATVAYGPSLGGLALASDSDKAFSIWPEPLGSF